MQQVATIEKDVQVLSDAAEFDYVSDKSSKYKDKILSIIKQIDVMLTDEGQCDCCCLIRCSL